MPDGGQPSWRPKASSASAQEVLRILQSLHRDLGKTVIPVTHNPKAAAFADRTVHLEKGGLLPAASA